MFWFSQGMQILAPQTRDWALTAFTDHWSTREVPEHCLDLWRATTTGFKEPITLTSSLSHYSFISLYFFPCHPGFSSKFFSCTFSSNLLRLFWPIDPIIEQGSRTAYLQMGTWGPRRRKRRRKWEAVLPGGRETENVFTTQCSVFLHLSSSMNLQGSLRSLIHENQELEKLNLFERYNTWKSR